MLSMFAQKVPKLPAQALQGSLVLSAKGVGPRRPARDVLILRGHNHPHLPGTQELPEHLTGLSAGGAEAGE